MNCYKSWLYLKGIFDIRSLLTWINFSCSNIFKELVSLLLSPQFAFLIETGCKGKGFFQISKAANHFFRICFKERLPKPDYCVLNAHHSFCRHNALTFRHFVTSNISCFCKEPRCCLPFDFRKRVQR